MRTTQLNMNAMQRRLLAAVSFRLEVARNAPASSCLQALRSIGTASTSTATYEAQHITNPDCQLTCFGWQRQVAERRLHSLSNLSSTTTISGSLSNLSSTTNTCGSLSNLSSTTTTCGSLSSLSSTTTISDRLRSLSSTTTTCGSLSSLRSTTTVSGISSDLIGRQHCQADYQPNKRRSCPEPPGEHASHAVQS